MRYTEYHAGVSVIKDKALLKEAMAKLAKYEDKEDKGKALIADLVNRSRKDILCLLVDYCSNRNCGSCVLARENCDFSHMDDAELKDVYKKVVKAWNEEMEI